MEHYIVLVERFFLITSLKKKNLLNLSLSRQKKTDEKIILRLQSMLSPLPIYKTTHIKHYNSISMKEGWRKLYSQFIWGHKTPDGAWLMASPAEKKDGLKWKRHRPGKTQSNHKLQNANFSSDTGPVQWEENPSRKVTGGEGVTQVLLLLSVMTSHEWQC